MEGFRSGEKLVSQDGGGPRQSDAEAGHAKAGDAGPANESQRGFVLTSGAIAFVVESEAAAKARGATIYGTIGEARSALTLADAIVPGERVLGSANATWIDRAERIALR